MISVCGAAVINRKYSFHNAMLEWEIVCLDWKSPWKHVLSFHPTLNTYEVFWIFSGRYNSYILQYNQQQNTTWYSSWEYIWEMGLVLDDLFVYSFTFRLSVKEKYTVLNVWNVFYGEYFKKWTNLQKFRTENID